MNSVGSVTQAAGWHTQTRYGVSRWDGLLYLPVETRHLILSAWFYTLIVMLLYHWVQRFWREKNGAVRKAAMKFAKDWYVPWFKLPFKGALVYLGIAIAGAILQVQMPHFYASLDRGVLSHVRYVLGSLPHVVETIDAFLRELGKL